MALFGCKKCTITRAVRDDQGREVGRWTTCSGACKQRTEGRPKGRPSRIDWEAARFWAGIAVMAAVAYGSLFYAWWPQ